MENASWLRGRRVHWARLLAFALVGLGAAGLLYAQNPEESRWFPKCAFHWLTGWHCPGCGATRASHALMHGDLSAALANNVLFVCVGLPTLAVWLGFLTIERKDTTPRRPLAPVWIWGILLLIVTFTILRNIPAYPFTLLAPH